VPNTFEKIASVTVGAGGAANIEFTSIPATFTDLCVKVSARSSASASLEDMYLRLNGDTGSVYTSRNLRGNGATASSASSSGTSIYFSTIPAATNTASTFSNSEFYIPNYLSSTAKSISSDAVQEANGTTAWAALVAGLWNPATQAAITSIRIFPDTNFAQYSTATLYGIKNS
jgi:hypothetical protein